MFSLTKRQVKSLLEVIANDDTRPILMQSKIDLFEGKPVLVATDSYKMVIFALSDAVLPELGKMIDRSEIVKWYKLANAKDIFTEADLIDLPATTIAGKYPEWQKLVPLSEEIAAQEKMSLNASYLLELGILAGNTGMTLEFYGRMRPIVCHFDNNIFILMPLKN